MKALSSHQKEYVKFPLCPEIILIESEFIFWKTQNLWGFHEISSYTSEEITQKSSFFERN